MIIASFCLIILWLALSMITKPNTTNYTYRSAVYNYYSYKQTGNNFVDKSCNLCSYKHYIFLTSSNTFNGAIRLKLITYILYGRKFDGNKI